MSSVAFSRPRTFFRKGNDMGSNGFTDTVGRLLEDLDRAAGSDSFDGKKVAGIYFGSDDPQTCGRSYVTGVVWDVSRRLHALMPHDRNGREIKAGDEARFDSGVSFKVEELKVLPLNITKVAITSKPEERVTVVEPDSWERLEEDIAKDTTCDYFGTDSDGGCHSCPANHSGGCRESMAADIVRRAKALAGVE